MCLWSVLLYLFSSNDDSDIKLSYSCQKLQSNLAIADTCSSWRKSPLIARCLLYRGFMGIKFTKLNNFMGSKFCKICVFWMILWPSSRKNFCETLNSEIGEILDDSLNREKWEEVK